MREVVHGLAHDIANDRAELVPMPAKSASDDQTRFDFSNHEVPVGRHIVVTGLATENIGRKFWHESGG